MNEINEDEIYLNLYGNTWETNVNNLYDYQSKEIKEFKVLIKDKTIIKRKDQEIFEENSNEENNEYIFNIKKSDKKKVIMKNLFLKITPR